MEAKEAYQQLLDEKEGRAGRGPAGGAGSARGGRAPGSGASGWGGYQSGSSTSSGYGRASSYQGQQRWQPPEPDYSFGDMLRDLEKELSSYAAERQRKRSSAATGGGGGSASVPKSLWEELYDIGEEFVEFLEQNLGVSEDEAASYSAFKKEYGDASGSRNAAGSGSRSSDGGRASSSRASSSGGASAPSGRSMADAFGSTGGNSSRSSSSSAGASAPPPGKSREQYVEDELAALKRKLGRQ